MQKYLSKVKMSAIAPAHSAAISKIMDGYVQQVAAKAATPSQPGTAAFSITHASREHELKVQLAAVADWARPFVQATYDLESNNLVVFTTYDTFVNLDFSMNNPSLATVVALSERFVESLVPQSAPNLRQLKDRQVQKDLDYVRAVVGPAVSYARTKFGNILECTGCELSENMAFYKAARLLDPFKAKDLILAAGDSALALVDALAASFLKLKNSLKLIVDLKAEMPKYAAAVHDLVFDEFLDRSEAISSWWAGHALGLPAWAACFRVVSLASPSNAATERVFSVVRRTFDKSASKTALEDYVEASVMLQYNHKEGA